MTLQEPQHDGPQNPGKAVWVPNVLSIVRLGIAMAFPFMPHDWHLAAILAGGATDFLDGFLARVLNAQSAFGRIIDPIADKALFLSVLVTLASQSDIHWWQVLLVCVRDIVVLFQGIYIAKRGDWRAFLEMSPGLIGKITTALVFLWIMALMIAWAAPAATPLFIAAVICSFLTAISYTQRFILRWRNE